MFDVFGDGDRLLYTRRYELIVIASHGFRTLL